MTAYVLPSTSGGSDRIQIDPLLGVPAVGNVTGTMGALVLSVTQDNKTVYVHGSYVKALPIGVWPLDTATNTVGAMIPLPAGSNSMAITTDGGGRI